MIFDQSIMTVTMWKKWFDDDDVFVNSQSDKQTHSDGSLQKLLHEQHDACTHSSERVWLLLELNSLPVLT